MCLRRFQLLLFKEKIWRLVDEDGEKDSRIMRKRELNKSVALMAHFCDHAIIIFVTI